MTNKHKEIGKRIKRKRLGQNLHPSDLATLCHVQTQTIESWEEGIDLPEGGELYLLAQNLKTNADFLTYGEDDYSSSKTMGEGMVTTLVILAFACSIIILLSGLSSLATKAPLSTGFSIIALSVCIFCVLYWMASILSSVIAIRSTNEKILQELLKANKTKKM